MIKAEVCLLLILAPSLADSHHSSAGYDFTTVEEIEGQLVSISWQNPHVRLALREVGSAEDWELEAQDVNSLGRSGLSAEMLQVGDFVRVAGHPLRRGGNTLFLTNVLLPDGVEIRTRGEDTKPRWSQFNAGFERVNLKRVQTAAGEVTGLFRVWMSRDRKFFPLDLPLTDKARAFRESWDPADSLTERCVTPGMPSAMEIGGPHPIEFREEDGVITFRAESFDVVRTVHLDVSRGEVPEEPSAFGRSIGRWEGDTLIVETSQISWPYLDRLGSIPQSASMTTVERFYVNDTDDTMTYTLTMTDPETLTEPVTIEWLLDWRPDLEIEAYDCQSRGI